MTLGDRVKQLREKQGMTQEELGVSAKGIRDCCIGRQKTCGGYIWKKSKGRE